MQSPTAAQDPAVQLRTCPLPPVSALIAPKPPATTALASARPIAVPASDAVRSSIRRFLAVSNPDEINMLDVYRHLQREYGEEEVNQSKLGIRNCTKSILDEMMAAQPASVNGSPTAARKPVVDSTMKANGDVSPLIPVLLPIALTSRPQRAPPVLPVATFSVPLPPPAWSASQSDDLPPPLESVPSYPHAPSSPLCGASSATTALAQVAQPTLPLANGRPHPQHKGDRSKSKPREERKERGEAHGSGGSGGSSSIVALGRSDDEKKVEDSEGNHQEEHSEHDSDGHNEDEDDERENDEEEEDEEKERKEKEKKKLLRQLSRRSKKKRKPNKPLAVDDETGQEMWEVRKIHRSDVNDRGEKVYKVSWWNWTVWPTHTWIRRDEWMGDTRELDELEEKEREAAEREQKRAAGGAGYRPVKRHKMGTGKNHKGDITAQTSWAFDDMKVREVDERLRQKAQKEREAERAKKQTMKGKQTKGNVKKAKQKITVKQEEIVDEAAAADEVEEVEVDEEARAELLRAEAQMKRDERRRLQEEEDRRVVPLVRANSRYLIPWSSDDEAEEETKAVEQESEMSNQRRKRRERRRLLRLHQLSQMLHRKSRGTVPSASNDNEVRADGGVSDTTSGGDDEDREMREEAEVSVHESELTSESSEAEMDKWRAERVYRVESILDHRRVGEPSRKEQAVEKREEADRRKRKVERAAALKEKRMNAFNRAQQRVEGQAAEGDEQKDAHTEQTEVREEERKEGVEEAVAMADGGDDVDGDEAEEEDEETGGGPLEYLVQWSGHSDKQQSWESEANLRYGCKLMLRDYKLMVGLAIEKRKAGRHTKKRKRGRGWY